MKRLIVLLFAFLLSITLLSAQEFNAEQAEHYLQTTLTQHGEESSEYLATLDQLCIVAEQYNHTDIAIKYRQKHIEVIERTKGADSNEWAEDYTKFGELLFSLDKLELALPLFLQSLCVYENNSCPYNYYYQLCVGRISDCYRKLEQYDQALIYQEKYLNIARELFGDIDYIYLWANVIAAHLAGMVDHWDKVELYSRNVLDVISINEDNFYIYENAQLCMHTYLWRNKQYQEATDLAIEFSENTKKFKGEISLEYAKSLSQIAGNYHYMDNAVLSVEYSLKAVNVYEIYYADSKDGLYRDAGYYKECNCLATLYALATNLKEEYKYRKIIYDILVFTGREETKECFEALRNLFNTSARLGDYQHALSMADTYHGMIQSFSADINADLYGFYTFMTSLHINTNSQVALEYIKKRVDIAHLVYSGDDLKEALFESYIAIVQTTSDVEESQKYFKLAEQLANNFAEESYYYKKAQASILDQKGRQEKDVNKRIELYTQALSCIEELLTEAQMKLDSLASEHKEQVYRNELFVITLSQMLSSIEWAATIRTNKGYAYCSIGNYLFALQDFKASLEVTEQLDSPNSYDYVSNLINVALCELNMGLYANAIESIDKALQISKAQFGENSYIYATCLLNLGTYYQSAGQYVQAYYAFRQAVDIFMEVTTPADRNYISGLLALSNILSKANIHDDAIFYAQEAYKLVEKIDIQDTLLSDALITLSNAYIRAGKYEEGFNAWGKAQNHLLSMSTDNRDQTVKLARLYADFSAHLLQLGLYEDARRNITNALYFLYNLKMYYSPITTQVLFRYGLSSMFDNYVLEYDYYSDALICLKNMYDNNIAIMTEKDREEMWKQVSAYKDIFFTASKDDDKSGLLLDYILFSKSILLNTSTKFSKAIMNSGDDELIEKYHQLLAMKDAENRRMQMNGLSIVPSQDIPRLEREILSKIEVDDYIASMECTHADISNVLKGNEVAIEFVDYTDLKTDIKQYVALVMRKGWQEPKYIPLFSADELTPLLEYSPQALYDKGKVGAQLYDLIWAPLSSVVNAGDVVYFAPAGELYTLAVEAIYSPQGKPLNEQYQMVRLTSTREVFNLSDYATMDNAVLYGGLKYDISPDVMAQMSELKASYDVASIAYDGGSQTRAGWDYLPGTQREVEMISNLMQKESIKHTLYQEEYGNEESFKMLSGKGHKVLHLATHGFFISNEEAKHKLDVMSIDFLNNENSAIDPMSRSGLLFAGGNNVWTGKKLQEGVEDGIMTATEISTMDLSDTDIVILSACDTGLGDVSGDGVFGLQRAFKQAGVETIVMSLWRVDDRATELMMTTFYKNLMAGKTKREAFELAQVALRDSEPFSNPYYWASFVMLD